MRKIDWIVITEKKTLNIRVIVMKKIQIVVTKKKNRRYEEEKKSSLRRRKKIALWNPRHKINHSGARKSRKTESINAIEWEAR